MDLAELKFVVDTKELEKAATRVKELGTEVSKLNKPLQNLSKESAKTNKELAKAEEAAAKAALAQTKLEQAQAKSAQTAAKSSSVLERQNLILEYMAQGNSKGQASILATAKAAGALDDEMLQLNKTLVTQRTLIGGDPFDKSIGLMQKLQNEYKTTTEVTNLFNKNLGLTQKQMTDLAREKERLVALYGIEGKSLNGLSAEYDQLIQKSVKINQANSQRTNSMKAQVKAQDDAARATDYIASEMDRLNRLTESNGSVTSATNNKLIKFEQALKATGMSANEQVIALEKYKASLLSVQKAAGNRQIDYLSRALGPQITDIGVGLATGQAPLTILLQQGGQLRDQFALAGVAGSEMGKMLVQASKAMVTSIKDIGLAVGQLVTGAIAGTGKAIFDGIIAPFKRLSEARDALKQLDDGLISSTRYARLMELATGRMYQSLFSLGKVIGVTAAIGLGLLAKGLYDVIKEQDAMTTQLVLTGASLGVNTTAAISYANSLNSVGVTTANALKVMQEMAKEGGFVAGEINMIVTSANNLKLAGVSIEDTVKQFAKLKEKPVEALLEIAKATGMVSPEVTKLVYELSEQGKTSEAAAVAMKAYADVTIKQKDRLKSELSDFALFMKSLSSNVGEFFDEVFRGLFRKASPTEAIKREIADLENTIKLGTQASDTTRASNDAKLTALKEQLRISQQASDLEQTRASDQARNAKAYQSFIKDQSQFASNEMKRTKELAEAENQYQGLVKSGQISQLQYETLLANIREKYKTTEKAITVAPSKDLSIVQKDYNEQLRLAEGFARDERSVLKARFDAGLIDRAEFITKDIDLLTRSEQKQLDVIDTFSAKYTKAYDAQANALSQALAKTKDPENRAKLSGDIQNLVKDFLEFNATLDDTKTKIGSAFSAREQVALLEFEKAAFTSTKTFKEYARTQEDLAANKRIDIELQYRLSNAYGAEAAQIKAVAEETKKQTAEISKFTKAQEEAYKQYLIVLSNPASSLAQLEAAGGAYTTAMINANKAISISRVSIENAGTDAIVAYYKQEYDRIINGVADSIVTALFEGGKAGSKQLRNLIIAELKKPITIVVKALVDATLGSFIQSVVGGGGGSFAGSAAGSAATGGMSNIMIGGATLGAQAGAFGSGVSSAFSLGAPVQSMGNATSASFNAGATYGAPVLSAVGGMAINRGISNGYKINSTMNTVEDIATVVAAAINPVLGLVVGALSGLTNRAFGRKLAGVGVEGTLGGSTGFEGNRYTFEKGGFFRSDKTTRSTLEESDRSAIASDFRLIKTSVMDLAESAGFGSAALDNFTQRFAIDLMNLSPEDAIKKYQEEFAKVEESMAKAVIGTTGYRRENETNIQALIRISSFMSGVNGAFKKLGFETYKLELASLDAAQSFVDLFGGIEGFNKATAFFYENFFSVEEKMANLAGDLTIEFDKLGLALPTTREAFRALVVAAKEAGDDQQVKNLLDLQYAFAELVPITEEVVGVVDVLTETMKGLLKERASLEVELLQVQGKTNEANAALRRIATEGFTEAEIAAYDYNQSLKTQIQGYKNATEAASTYKKITDGLIQEQINLNIELLKVQGKTAEANAMLRTLATEGMSQAQIAIYDYNQSLKTQIQSFVDAKAASEQLVQNTKRQTDAALESVKRSIAAEKELVQVRLDAALKEEEAIKAIFDVLSSAISDIRGQSNTAGSLSSARALISNAINTGVLPNADKLSDAINIVRRSIESTSYATKTEQIKAGLKLANELESLQDIAQPQLSAAERAVVIAQDQLVVLDNQLKQAQLQVDTLRGVDNSIISLTTAMSNLAIAISAEFAATAKEQWIGNKWTSTGGAIATMGSDGLVNVNSKTNDTFSADQAIKFVKNNLENNNPRNVYDAAIATGISATSLDALMGWDAGTSNAWAVSNKLPMFADGGYYPGGLALVGETGPELINFNRSGQVYNAAQTSSLMGGSSSEELAAIRQELIMLRAETRAVVSNTSKTAKILDRSSPDGQSLQVTVVTP